MSNQPEQNYVLGNFIKRLDKIGVEHMLTGSMALTHYAVPRATVDIDLVINLLPEKLESFIREFEGDYYIPLGSAETAVQKKRMFNVLNQESIIKIDCIILKEDNFQQNVFARRKKVNYSGDFDVWIITREDLILSKLLWAKRTDSERQLLDVASIIRHGFDQTYLNEWIKKLGLEELFDQSKSLLNQNYDERYDS